MPNALYGQAGGVTAVINASAQGVIEAARRYPERIGHLFAARDGIVGLIEERLVDTSSLSAAEVHALGAQPGGIFGACRFDLKPLTDVPALYERIFAVLAAHDIRYFFYNGGNGSQDTALQMHRAAQALGYPLACIGIPKTVDNDIALTDCCPGFGSAAKYLATSVREMALDMASMASRRARLLVVEVMGRNVGWLAAATTLARREPGDAPHVVILPEVPFDIERVAAQVAAAFARQGWCMVVVAEGARDAEGRLLAERGRDAAGYVQLGGAGQAVAEQVRQRLECRYHIALPDYMQRAARHLASSEDVRQAHAVGEAAVDVAVQGISGCMPTIVREADAPYRWRIGRAALESVANLERGVEATFIDAGGLDVTEAFTRWCRPLIAGEAIPPFRDGLPDYPRLYMPPLMPRLASFVWPT